MMSAEVGAVVTPVLLGDRETSKVVLSFSAVTSWVELLLTSASIGMIIKMSEWAETGLSTIFDRRGERKTTELRTMPTEGANM